MPNRCNNRVNEPKDEKDKVGYQEVDKRVSRKDPAIEQPIQPHTDVNIDSKGRVVRSQK